MPWYDPESAGPADGPSHRNTAAMLALRPPLPLAVVAVTMFIPNSHMPLTDAVAEAFVIEHAAVILAAGLQPHEAKQIADHWLARDRLKVVKFQAEHGTRFARRGKRMVGVVPRQPTAQDHAMARETAEIKALSEKGAKLRSLLDDTWSDLRNSLFTGKLKGHLSDADTGKYNEIAAPQWARDDADIAHVTGWFSIPHAWGHFVGPVLLLRSDFEGLVAAAAPASKSLPTGDSSEERRSPWSQVKTRLG